MNLKCAKLPKKQSDSVKLGKTIDWSCEKCTNHTESSPKQIPSIKSVSNESPAKQLTMEDKIDMIFTKMSNMQSKIANIETMTKRIESIEINFRAMEQKISKIDELEEGVKFVTKEYDDFKVWKQDVNKKNKEFCNDFNHIGNCLMNMKANVKTLNDEKVKNDIVIHKVTLDQENQTATDYVQNILNCLKVPIRDFSCHSSVNRGGACSIFVKFLRHEEKMLLMKSKKNLKNHEQYKNLSIFDILGPETLDTFKYAKLLKNHNYTSVFTVGNKVMAKLTEDARPFNIKDKNHVDQLLNKRINRSNGQTTGTT